MNYFIGIEDLAANALIAVLAKKEKRFVSYDDMERYGNKVIEVLGQRGKKAILVLSRESTFVFYRDYSDYFKEAEIDGVKGIFLKESKNVEDLIDAFRGYLALDLLLAFTDDLSVETLGVSA